MEIIDENEFIDMDKIAEKKLGSDKLIVDNDFALREDLLAIGGEGGLGTYNPQLTADYLTLPSTDELIEQQKRSYDYFFERARRSNIFSRRS